MKTPPEETRERLLAFVAIARATLGVNPQAALSTLCRQVGCSNRVASELIAMGVIAVLPESAGHQWKDGSSNEVAVDALIVYRRKQSAPQSSEELASLRRDVAELQSLSRQREDSIPSLRDAFANLVRRVVTLEERPMKAKISEEDLEILNLAINDDKNKNARIGELESIVGNLLRAQAAREGILVEAPKTHRKWNIGVCGIHERDSRHVQDGLSARLGRNHGVTLTFIPHDPRNAAAFPSGLDAVITTPIAAPRAKEAQAKYPANYYPASGGNRAVVEQIVLITGGAR